jgi:hypothetical protein
VNPYWSRVWFRCHWWGDGDDGTLEQGLSDSPYLNDVRSGISEGPARVCPVRYVDLLQILADGVLFRGSSWLAFDATILASFGMFYRKVQNLQHSILMMKDCKLVFLEGFLQPMFFQWILDLIVSSKWILLSSKPCFTKVFTCGPFLHCLCKLR